jgi:redox-sensitive bicupin YhaK (pirin superfamily)
MFGPQGDGIALQAKGDVKLLVLAGKPLGEPISHYGPFVMNTQDEIKQAMADFRAGKMGSTDYFES